MIFMIFLCFIYNTRIIMDETFGFEELLFSAKTKSVPTQKRKIINFAPTSLPDCLNNLHYPSCPFPNHQSQPLSLVCIDEQCSDKSLICALCQNEKHYKHLCVPLKFYLNQVYGHLYAQKEEELMPMKLQPQLNPSPKQRKKNKNKGKAKNIPEAKISPTIKSSKNVLFYTSDIQNQKQEFLTLIAHYRENLIEKLHNLETISIKYFNKKIQQASMLVALENPVQNIEKMVNNLQNFKEMKQQAIDTKQSAQYSVLINQETNKLKNYIFGILKITKCGSKFQLPQRLKQIASKTAQIIEQMSQNLFKVHSKYEEEVINFQKSLEKELQSQIEVLDSSKIQFKFSDKFKGHKFVVRNQGKVAEQTGMESSGQRFLLMQPCLPKNTKFGNQKCSWGVKLIKLAGWIAIGISLKNSIINSKYTFNYNNIGHGSYLISANGYSWSHSLKDFNSTNKSFTFATGDTIYLQYDPALRKLKFFKNTNKNQFQLDIADPPQNDEYCPSVNMCSSGDTVELIYEKPDFL